jgi:L-threonylcarbamoyladenylate synthase
MKVIRAADLAASPELYRDIVSTIKQDGLACFPVGAAYRVAANVFSAEAVTRLMQSKRRAAHHPALIFVAGAEMLGPICGQLSPTALRLAHAFWPGLLTLLLEPGADLPPKVVKILTRATGKIGVRCPADKIAAQVVRELDGPMLVSSANLERKMGAGSLAQVRKNFQQRIDLLVDAGDLQPSTPSTLVDVEGDGWRVTRVGAVAEEAIAAAIASA